MCTQQQSLQILKSIYEQCNPIFDYKITDAILYGSYARGDYHAESDIDILLAVNTSAANIALLRNRLASITSGLSLQYDVTVSVTAKPSEQFARYGEILPYYINVREEGIRYAG